VNRHLVRKAETRATTSTWRTASTRPKNSSDLVIGRGAAAITPTAAGAAGGVWADAADANTNPTQNRSSPGRTRPRAGDLPSLQQWRSREVAGGPSTSGTGGSRARARLGTTFFSLFVAFGRACLGKKSLLPRPDARDAIACVPQRTDEPAHDGLRPKTRTRFRSGASGSWEVRRLQKLRRPNNHPSPAQ
jgi:hypothetical protein